MAMATTARVRWRGLAGKVLVAASVFLPAAPAGAATLINGAGATFPYPLYSKWFDAYQAVDKDAQFNYQSIGSGGGIRQFAEQKTVDFGASDAPMTDEQLAKAGAPVVHVPTVLGAVAVTYHLPGVATGLKLDGALVADIFLGKVTKWDDARITAQNPGAKLSGDIVVVRRSDGSGTTAIFTDFLSRVSEPWKTTVGAANAVKWPVGLGGKGNEGVAGLLKQTPGSIGYVELIYAESNKLPYAAIKNAAGQYVLPSMASVTAAAAAEAKRIPADYRVSIANASGRDSYPIAGFTYLLVWKDNPDTAKGPKIKAFLKWAVSAKGGQQYAEKLYYAPLPKDLVAKVEKTIGTMTVGGKP
jgi:phosphate transport system substrate-binding protein